MEWLTVEYVTPPIDKDVLCLLSSGEQAVCYYFDNRFTYSNNQQWGFDVVGWKDLEKKEDILKHLERGF